ncbi:MAG: hypothetical protein M0Z95_25460 [Actinomycetota bacterium]|nr:hypothetical protein [Actinomycetota bacterium]
MLIVENDPSAVEADLAAGRFLCPSCTDGILARWGFARRRTLRDGQELRPRRGYCCPKVGGCGSTHVLLPDICLLRRKDAAQVIGEVLQAVVIEGESLFEVAARLGIPADTVWGWLRRLRRLAGRIVAHVTRWLLVLEPGRAAPDLEGCPAAQAIEGLGALARAASLRFGLRPPWSWASAVSAGRLLSNTNAPWPGPD